jgi:hypothetical protein
MTNSELIDAANRVLDFHSTSTSKHAAAISLAHHIRETVRVEVDIRKIGGMVIRYDNEITPERLIACGAEERQTHFVIESGKSVIYLGLHPKGRWVIIDHNGTRSSWYGEMTPSNIGKLWELMDYCGIEVPT